ncbi:conserved unknown protein [Ectocarpus siliculosus]|uniref:Pentacotripeptide-repeat region of PRORP domain-containing protein n=1 Tax=Ectocarpus siliculosus TaxID=2880 RepID=D8LFU5_ECTSI|nr:conserved unknown protein [Ectocarpus siliculosus]|eukprot:CBN78844.1 conserved unknown protein [Ectocarpus siliculosus]
MPAREPWSKPRRRDTTQQDKAAGAASGHESSSVRLEGRGGDKHRAQARSGGLSRLTSTTGAAAAAAATPSRTASSSATPGAGGVRVGQAAPNDAVAGGARIRRATTPAMAAAAVPEQQPSSAGPAINLAGGGGHRWRGLATTPAAAADAEGAGEELAGDTAIVARSGGTGSSSVRGGGALAPSCDSSGGDASGSPPPQGGAEEDSPSGPGVAAEASPRGRRPRQQRRRKQRQTQPPNGDGGKSAGDGGGGDGVVGISSGGDGAAGAKVVAATAGGVPSLSFAEKCRGDLRRHAKRGEGEKAVALIARMREAGVMPTERSYTSAINACRNGTSQWKEALELLKEAQTAGGGGITPNAFHYTGVLRACADAGQLDQIPPLKSEMASLGISPGLSYYHGAMAAAKGAAQGWKTVKELVSEMSEKRVVPSQNTYRLVDEVRSGLGSSSSAEVNNGGIGVDGSKDGASDGGDVEAERLVSMLRGIDGAPPPATTKTEGRERAKRRPKTPPQPAATAEVEAEEEEEEEEEEARGGGAAAAAAATRRKKPRSKREAGSRPALGSLQACNRDLRRYADRGAGDAAAELIGRMRKDGVQPTAKSYTSAINACKNGGQWERALALLREAPESGVALNAFHFVAAIKACGSAHQWDQVAALVSEMSSREISPNVEFYNWAIKAAASPKTGGEIRASMTRGGGWRAVEQHVDDAKSNSSAGGGDGGDGGNDSKPAAPSAGEAAAALLREMSEKGVAPDSITYTLVMTACRVDGEPERALAVLREMQKLASETEAEADVGPVAETVQEEAGVGGEGGDREVGKGSSHDGANDSGASGSPAVPSPHPPRRRRRRRRRREGGAGAGGVVVPNVIHYSSVMSAFADHPGGWKHVLRLMKEMEMENR